MNTHPDADEPRDESNPPMYSYALREDEEEEMQRAEDVGIVRYSDDWERWLAMYRGSLRWHWLGLGLAEKDLRDLGGRHLRRVLRKAMGYELP